MTYYTLGTGYGNHVKTLLLNFKTLQKNIFSCRRIFNSVVSISYRKRLVNSEIFDIIFSKIALERITADYKRLRAIRRDF